MINELIFLKSEVNSVWTSLFLPTLIMLGSIPFWFVRPLHNLLFRAVAYLAVIGLPLLILITSCCSDDPRSPGILGGIFLFITMIALNAAQMFLYIRILRNRRCPNCHSLRMKTIKKNTEEYTTVNTTVYKGNNSNKRYYRDVRDTTTFTTYTNYCPACDSLISWTEESNDSGVHDTRPQ